jgi:hypothetical protein
VFSIEDRIWNHQRASVSDAVVRMLGQSLLDFVEPFRAGRNLGSSGWNAELKRPKHTAKDKHFGWFCESQGIPAGLVGDSDLYALT